MTPQFAPTRVSGTPEAIELIESLAERHGPVALFHSGGSFDEGELRCLTRAELLPSPEDIRVGEVGGAPVYVDGRLYERRGRPDFMVEVEEGPARGLCLDGLEELHLVASGVNAVSAR
jgi:uncharacterized protein